MSTSYHLRAKMRDGSIVEWDCGPYRSKCDALASHSLSYMQSKASDVVARILVTTTETEEVVREEPGLLIFTAGPAEALELARQLGAHPLPRNFSIECDRAYEKLARGEIVVAAGTSSLVTGWHAPENTIVVFTDSFVERNPPQSACYQQARLRARPWNI